MRRLYFPVELSFAIELVINRYNYIIIFFHGKKDLQM